MKTHSNQIITVVGLFSLSIASTLGISWGITSLLFQGEHTKPMSTNKIIIQHSKSQLSIDYIKSFRLLIPKSK
jgi:hypothetical protein